VAITIDWPTLTFTVQQADLTFVQGTFYRMDTENFYRAAINAIMASGEGIVFDRPIIHNTEVTVAGVTYARFIEQINGYKLVFLPNTQWSVELVGSNNNLFDIENLILVQNQVQVIPTNSAGLISSPKIDDLHTRLGLELGNPITDTKPGGIKDADGKIDIVRTGDGEASSTLTRQP